MRPILHTVTYGPGGIPRIGDAIAAGETQTIVVKVPATPNAAILTYDFVTDCFEMATVCSDEPVLVDLAVNGPEGWVGRVELVAFSADDTRAPSKANGRVVGSTDARPGQVETPMTLPEGKWTVRAHIETEGQDVWSDGLTIRAVPDQDGR